MTRANVAQAAILILSGLAAWLVTDPGPSHRWGCVVGLVAQPFWLAVTWRARQWGMFALAIYYCVAWGRGVYFGFLL